MPTISPPAPATVASLRSGAARDAKPVDAGTEPGQDSGSSVVASSAAKAITSSPSHGNRS
jgi:hypothetical protein